MLKSDPTYKGTSWQNTQINSWTVLYVASNDGKSIKWRVRCKCGSEYDRFSLSIISGQSKSCKSCALSTFAYCGPVRSFYLTKLEFGAEERGILVSLTLQDLNDLWYDQKGICALSGRVLILKEKDSDSGTASLDRKDSKQGYDRNNIQWVDVEVNRAKQDMTDAGFIQLCKEVAANNNAVN